MLKRICLILLFLLPLGIFSAALKGEGLIKAFFGLLNQGKVSPAMQLLDQSSFANQAAWKGVFNSFSSVEIKTITPSMPEEWTAKRQTYKVTIKLRLGKVTVNTPIPNYGWENGLNTRWVELKNLNGAWKISNFATGP